MIRHGKINICKTCFRKGNYETDTRIWGYLELVPRLRMGAGLIYYPCHICSVRKDYQKWCPLEAVEFLVLDHKIGHDVLAI